MVDQNKQTYPKFLASFLYLPLVIVSLFSGMVKKQKALIVPE